MKLSVVITTFNSENKIEDCLRSVSFGDEIIVVDGTSTDKTLEIIKKFTSKIFIKPNNPMLNINKNFGFSKAIGEWILCIDADERVTPELQREIMNSLGGSEDGYWIPRKNILFGKWMRHTGWYPDPQLRLFRRGKGKFPEEHVHEMVKITGETGKLDEHILHYNYDNISQFLQKLGVIYGPNEAAQLLKKGYVFDWKDSIRFPVKEFLSRFFAREGYRDGFHGFMLSILMAFYHFIIFAYIWEKLKFKETENENLLVEAGVEMRKSYKDLSFWFSKEILKNEKNYFKKILHKLSGKLKN
jgi:glycosyltransferase involved in cell wall biosynthesis